MCARLTLVLTLRAASSFIGALRLPLECLGRLQARLGDDS